MMHTGIVVDPTPRETVQLCVSRHRLVLSSSEGESWSSRLRHVRISDLGEAVIRVELGGVRWTIRLDDPDRFRWNVVPRLQRRSA